MRHLNSFLETLGGWSRAQGGKPHPGIPGLMHALRAAAATAVFVFAAAGALRPLTRAGFASPPLRRPSRARLSAAGDDWLEAELSIRALSDAGLGPEATVRGVVRSLQFIDEPSPNAGLERVFDRFTWECRKAVRQGRTLRCCCCYNYRHYSLTNPASLR